MNKFIVTGFVAKDPQIFGTESKVAKFSLAAKRNFKNREGNYESDFIPITCYGKLAEFAEKYVKKGSSLEIEGAIRQNNYEKDGKMVYNIDHVAENINFGSGNKKATENEETQSKPQSENKESDSFIDAEEFGDLPWDM